MKFIYTIFRIAKASLLESITDRKNIILLLILGVMLDNGVRIFVEHAQQMGTPVNFAEGFLMCCNHWYYVVFLLIGFVFVLSDTPRLNEHRLFLIHRAGKKNWYFGEVLALCIYSFFYVLLFFLGTVAVCGKYSFVANVWSTFTVNYQSSYKELLSDSNRFVDQQVFKYYMPFEAAFHSFLLLWFCIIAMGLVILLFSILKKKMAGIIINLLMIVFVILFHGYRTLIMWISPFCHAVLMMHHVKVFKRMTVTVFWSYLYFVLLFAVLIFLSLKMLKRKEF